MIWRVANESLFTLGSPSPSVGRSPFMKHQVLLTVLMLTIVSGLGGADVSYRMVELPRPNSGTFSEREAAARKFEILSNAPTSKLRTEGVGLCIHIDKNDRISTYNHFLQSFPGYSDSVTNQSIARIVKLVDAIPAGGAPRRILITSEVPLKNSKAIHEILRVFFIPSVQLLYMRNSEQSGPASGSLPDGRGASGPGSH